MTEDELKMEYEFLKLSGKIVEDKVYLSGDDWNTQFDNLREQGYIALVGFHFMTRPAPTYPEWRERKLKEQDGRPN